MIINKEKERDLINILLLTTLPVIMNLIIGLVILLLFNSDKGLINVLAVWISMGVSFCIIPLLVLKSTYKLTLQELGIKKIGKFDMIMQIAFAMIFLVFIYYYYKESIIALLILTLQTLAVATTEEFWARGTLTFSLKKFINNKVIIILINALLFTFITHMNRPVLENLIYRLPGSILISTIYMRRENLNESVLAHFLLNIVGYYF